MTDRTGGDDDRWALRAADRALLGNKSGATRLGFAVLLKLFQADGRFPRRPEDVPVAAVEALASQVGVPAAAWRGYAWQGRTIEYHRAQVRAALGFREATLDDAEALGRWLDDRVLELERRHDRLLAAARERCRSLKLEPPSPDRLDRLVRSVLRRTEEAFGAAVLARLPPEAAAGLDALLRQPGPEGEDGGGEEGRAPLLALRAGAGPARLRSVDEEAGKLRRIRALALPPNLFDGVPSRVLLAYRRRVAAEELHELRRHPDPIRLTLLAAFCHVRGREIADALTDLLITTVHRIGSKAEKRVEVELIADLKRVAGKPAILFKLASASVAHPDGAVRDVIFPAVGEQTLRDLVAEGDATGPAYRRHLQAVIHNSYRSHHRRMLPLVLDALAFRSNNRAHRPVLDALAVIARHAGRKMKCYPASETPPLDEVVPAAWRDAVIEHDAKGRARVNRTAYEICALQALRERLRCKEIWVEGADRYRDPDEDLPADFDARRDEHYAALGLPRDARAFVERVRAEMTRALEAFDRGLARNPHVRVLKRGKGGISVAPLERQPEPAGLVALKAELGRRWPMTGLLDMLKEADLRIGFTGAFRTVTDHENLPRHVLQRRLLLCLNGLGTNTGLKRMCSGQDGVTHKDLLYIRRRFITREGLREAIAAVVNATLRARHPGIWGEGTTTCAADSKQFGAWDQNLMAEWHARYGGRGVITPWTTLRNPAWGGVAPRPGVDPEHHPDVLAVDLDPSHEGADDVASGRPIRLVQPVPDQGGEGLQLADDELQRAVLLGGVPERGGFGLEPRDAPAQPGQPRLELRLVDQPFGVPVDQPADAAAQLGELALDRLQLGPARPGAHGLEAAPVFPHDAGRVLEQTADLAPDRLVEALDADGPGVAPAPAVDAVPLRPGAAVVVVAVRRRARVVALPEAAERAAAVPADQQAL